VRAKPAAAGALLTITLLVGFALPARADSGNAERLLVTFTDAAAVADAIERFGGRTVGPDGWAGDADPAVMGGLKDVASVAPDGIVRAQDIPNDPCVTSCNGNQNEWYLQPIGASSAWDRSKGDGVTIAILDSGVDASHPDLVSKITASVDMTDVHDGNGEHGTKVAGIAGSATNNGIGVASLGWNVDLLSVKVLDINGEGFTSWVINGVDEAINRGAKIINLSLATTVFEQPLQDAINRAYNRGVLVVAAAGNNDDQGGSPTSPKYPAAMDHVLSVAATAQNDLLAAFSRRGPTVDIAAPGNALLTTLVGGGYGYASGTSAASPLAAAAAALLIAQGLEPSPDAVTAQLVRSGVPISDGDGGVVRRLQAGLATQTAAPYGTGFAGGNTVAIGDLDAVSPGEEIVTAAGPGGGPHVRVFSAAMNPLPVNFYAYGAGFRGGVDVAVGDVLPDITGDEIITATLGGGGPHVRVFLADGTPAPGQAGAGFYAYAPSFGGGVSIATGDVRPDVLGEEIITGAATGGGPHVRVFTADGVELGGGFMAFDPNFNGGIQVAVGDFDGQNGEQIAVAAGPGGAPHVKIFHYDATELNPGFYAYNVNFSGGVDIAAANVDGGREEVITVPKGAGGPHLRAFHTDGSAIGGGTFAYGGNVLTGFTVAGGATEIVVGTRAGPTFARALPVFAAS
jgi:hypothetical protein